MTTAQLTFQDEGTRAVSVTEFTRRVKLVLETGVRPMWIRGEVSNVRAQGSGHIYFSLKDAGAQVSAVLFRGDAVRQTMRLQDGLQVLVYGEVSVYEARGQYQLIVRIVVDDGVGRLQREFEALKIRLAAEGLFATERKKSLPPMPLTIGFITSPTGAAVQDFARIITRRKWCGRVVVLPTKVQGEGAATEMIAMLQLAQKLAMFDLLVIGRGGGSLEDLWAFNEEPLVRAVARCSLPIISAVGHEIDFTLCDFAADLRAETPSAAAELITSQFVGCAERVGQAAQALTAVAQASVQRAAAELDHARSRLRLLTPAALIEQGFLRLDDLTNRLSGAVRHSMHARAQELGEVRAQLAQRSPEKRVQSESHRLLSLWKRLQAASPRSVLNRGFVMLRDETGKPITRRVQTMPQQRLAAEFGDGTVAVRVE
jgi:exodeoxyribonuclease VII large subunit